MKMFKRLTWFLFVALFLLAGSAASASASPATADESLMWTALEPSINAIASEVLFESVPGSSYDFYMFNYSNTESMLISDPSLLFEYDGMSMSKGKADVFFRHDKDQDNWVASIKDVEGDLVRSMDLGSELRFGFYFADEDKNEIYNYTYEKDLSNQYSLSVLMAFPNTMQVDIIDAAPLSTPVPAAIFLFGSGLLGLVGLKRRNY